MAPLTPQEIDAKAAEYAATIQHADEVAAQTELDRPALALNAEGEGVTDLVNLLAVLGFADNSVIRGGPPKLDESVHADLVAARLALGVNEAETPADVVGQGTWAALYEAAGVKLEAPVPPAPGGGGPPAEPEAPVPHAPGGAGAPAA